MEIEDETQRLLRASNDHTHSLLFDAGIKAGDFLCECSAPSCAGVVTMSLAEYDLLRYRREFVHALSHDGVTPQAVSPIRS